MFKFRYAPARSATPDAVTGYAEASGGRSPSGMTLQVRSYSVGVNITRMMVYLGCVRSSTMLGLGLVLGFGRWVPWTLDDETTIGRKHRLSVQAHIEQFRV